MELRDKLRELAKLPATGSRSDVWQAVLAIRAGAQFGAGCVIERARSTRATFAASERIERRGEIAWASKSCVGEDCHYENC